MTDRQAQILSSIVETYARTAEPVGSLALANQIGSSPATIRAEMGELEQNGFIRQPHTSAGRIPTDKGYRHYVNGLAELPVRSPGRAADAIARRIRDVELVDDSIKTAAELIARQTGNVGIATLPNHIYRYGIANLIGQPEFFGHAAAFEAALLLDNLDEWVREIMAEGGQRIVRIGRENPIGKSSGTTAIVSRFRSPFSDQSYIGVVGPTRQDYPYVMGLVEYVGKVLEEQLA